MYPSFGLEMIVLIVLMGSAWVVPSKWENGPKPPPPPHPKKSLFGEAVFFDHLPPFVKDNKHPLFYVPHPPPTLPPTLPPPF